MSHCLIDSWKLLKKIHDATDVTIRNQKDSIKNIKTQLRKLTKLVNERLPSKNRNPKPQPHVMAMTTEEETISEPLVILNKESKQPDSQPKEAKIEEERQYGAQDAQHEQLPLMSWDQNNSFVKLYQPTLPYPS